MIVTLTLNPAIDRTLWLTSALQRQGLHRTTRVEEVPGGKGINVAGTLLDLGQEVLALTFRAGLNGERLARLLERRRIPHQLVEVDGETRECQTLIDPSGALTEVYERGSAIGPADLYRLSTLIPQACDLWISVSGSLPPGLSLADFSEWLVGLKSLGHLAVDTSGPALGTAIEARPYLVKPNQDELVATGLSAQQIWQQHGVGVLLSRGADGLEYHGPQGSYIQDAASIKPVNAVGAGDATLAGFLMAQAQRLPIVEALALAAACGAANAEEAGAGSVQPARVEQLRQTIAAAQMLEVAQ